VIATFSTLVIAGSSVASDWPAPGEPLEPNQLANRANGDSPMSNLINGTTNLALAPTLQDKQRLFVHCQPIQPQDATAELLAGLAQPPRSIAPKFFYDSHGAQLFDRITQLPEYYLTRVERQVFVEHSADMAAAIG